MNYFKLILLLFSSLILVNSPRLLARSEEKETKSTSKEKLIFAIDLIRHGDRNPIIAIPAVAHDWPEGLGQLTALGMHQEYELGKKCRQDYVSKEKLLPSSYQKGTLYVRSTDIDRTLMSATCFLTGLYPPGSGPTIGHSLFSLAALPHCCQPIPIHTVPATQDPLLIPDINKELHQYVFSTPEWRRKISILKPHYPSWSRATGVPIKSEKEVGFLGDTLFIHKLKHITLPKELSEEDTQRIIAQEKKEFKTLFNHPAVGKAAGGPLLRDISCYLEAAANFNKNISPKSPVCKKPHLKYVLYSAHDGTILGLMSALGVPLQNNPPYASDVKILLFEHADHSMFVRLLYNDKPIVLACCDSHGCCSLESFLRIAKAIPIKK